MMEMMSRSSGSGGHDDVAAVRDFFSHPVRAQGRFVNERDCLNRVAAGAFQREGHTPLTCASYTTTTTLAPNVITPPKRNREPRRDVMERLQHASPYLYGTAQQKHTCIYLFF